MFNQFTNCQANIQLMNRAARSVERSDWTNARDMDTAGVASWCQVSSLTLTVMINFTIKFDRRCSFFSLVGMIV